MKAVFFKKNSTFINFKYFTKHKASLNQDLNSYSSIFYNVDLPLRIKYPKLSPSTSPNWIQTQANIIRFSGKKCNLHHALCINRLLNHAKVMFDKVEYSVRLAFCHLVPPAVLDYDFHNSQQIYPMTDLIEN